MKILKQMNKKELIELVEKLQNKDNKWLYVKELGIDIETEVHDKNKFWNDLKLNEREEELLTIDECIILANHKKYSKILKMDGSSDKDDFFIQQPFDFNRKKGFVARFVAFSDRVYLDCNRDPQYSHPALGVRFKRKHKK